MDPVFVYISKVESAGGTAIYQTSMPKIWSKMKKNINIFRQILILPENPNLGIWSVTTHYIGSRKKACFFKAIWSGSHLRKNLVSVFSTKIWKKNLYGTSKTRNLRWSVTIIIIPELAMTCTSGCCWSLFFWLAPGWGLFCLRWRLFCVGETELDFLLRWWWCGFSWWW